MSLLGRAYQRFPQVAVESHDAPQNTGRRALRGQRDRGIGRVSRLEEKLLPMLTQKLHGCFLSQQSYDYIAGHGSVLLLHDYIVAGKEPSADHAVSENAQGEIGLTIMFGWMEGQRTFPVLCREHGESCPYLP